MPNAIKDTLTTTILNTAEGYNIPLWLLSSVFLLIAVLSPFITAYLMARSKNIAQKHDIEELTRKTETVKSEFDKHIEFLKHEYSLINHTYKLFVENIVEYYSMFFQHYLRCSRTTNYDLYTPKGGKPQLTSDIFEDQLEEFSKNWNNQLGLIKILLPDTLLKLHKKMETLFNDFRDIVMDRKKYQFDPNILNAFKPEYKKLLVSKFKKIDYSKNKMETEIRNILNVNKLVRGK